ncbi:hybrid sensor histidine kinase/response regulator [Haloarcula salina]|uniref:histidine kinase n=1 Tax=Haloarcula salina TaxID=1429914 RepID=A0AA41KE77_9EURY|nr:ATP-binding protein [Haloarcula salina]MBV0900597.1 response regulator [Haloarcula salina]
MDSPVTTGTQREGGQRLGPLHVVYVDSDDGDASEVRTTLSAADDEFDVRVCETADDALSALEDGAVDCVVSEYQLPDRDGVALLRAIRDSRPTLPFLLFTDDGDERVASDAISAGVTDYLTKTPLAEQTAVLRQRIAAAVSERHAETRILDRMTDAFFALNEDWEFTYLNDRGRQVIADAAEIATEDDDLLGRDIWEAIPSAVGTEFHEQYHRAMREQEAVSFEAYYDPLGTWFEVNAYPSASGLSVYFRDVTERREHERELGQREETLRETYRVVSRKDLDLEAKVERLLDIGREALGTDIAALSRIEGDTYVFEIVRDPTGETEAGDTVPLAATNCERAVVEEETLVLADIASDAPDLTERAGFTEMGITCYLGTPVVVDGEVYGTFCFYDTEPREPFTDWEVTLVELMGNWVSYERERERHREELTRERNRLEDFANVVSHDLRNPLNVAFGRLELIAAEYDGDTEHVAAARRALERMDELIEDVLALARGGDRVVDASAVALDDVVTAAWDTVESGDATLALVDEDARLTGDATRLQQLLENLFRNALEHGGESVTVRVGALPNGRGFFVEDDGPGLSEDDREQVFERGYTTSDDGTGFGLAIVKQIAEAHGGDVAVTESEAGGARFEVTGIPAG